jgi:hypothetical protein
MAEPKIYEGQEAIDRLEQLGLTVEGIEEPLRKADAEARTHTKLDPPHTPGIGRWGRTNRYLREQLVPNGWTYGNPCNLPRNHHPWSGHRDRSYDG